MPEALPDLGQLSESDRESLVLDLWTRLQAARATIAAQGGEVAADRAVAEELRAQLGAALASIAQLRAQVQALEARLGKPPKTPRNPSLPPSQAEKPNRAAEAAQEAQGAPQQGAQAASAAGPDGDTAGGAVRALRDAAGAGRRSGSRSRNWRPTCATCMRSATSGCARCCGTCKYALDAVFAPAMLAWPQRSIQMSRKRERVQDATLQRHRRDLRRRLEEILQREPQQADGQRLRQRYAKCKEGLLVFVTDREVPFTNDESERALRPSVIFRKATNGSRSEWGAECFAAVRSVIGTGRLNGLSPFDAIAQTIDGQSILNPI